MQNKNHWYRNFRFKLFAVLCAIAVLTSAVFVSRPAKAAEAAVGGASPAALSAGDADYMMSVVSWGVGRLDIFTVNRYDGSIWLKTFENQWYPWTSLGNPGTSFYSVSAVSWGPGRLDIFGVTESSLNVYTVWHKGWAGLGWSSWENVGSGAGNLASGVQAVSWASGHLEIFTRSTTNGIGSGPLLHKWFLNGSWGPSATGWETLDSSTAPATFFAVSHSANRMDLFRTLASNKAISRRSFNGSGWSGWYGMNNWLSVNTPYAVSWGSNRIDVFVRGTDGAIGTINTSNGGGSWSGWSSLGAANGGIWPASPSAVSWGSGRLDIFETEQYGRVFHKWYQGGWSGWEDLGGNFSVPGPGSNSYPPQPVSWGSSRIDLFQLNGDGKVFHKWTNGAGWGPSQTGWEDLGMP